MIWRMLRACLVGVAVAVALPGEVALFAKDGPVAATAPASQVVPAEGDKNPPKGGSAKKAQVLAVTVKLVDKDGNAVVDMKGVQVILDKSDPVAVNENGMALVGLRDKSRHDLIVVLSDGKCSLQLDKAHADAGKVTVLVSRKQGQAGCSLQKK